MAKKKANKQKERLFEEKLVPAKAGSGELFNVSFGDDDSPVECLGMTFENDAARREHFLNLLREKLQDPEFRKIEGFPIGSDDDIIAISDPPYYTACPNPFVEQFVKQDAQAEAMTYKREPFATDVSEGKNDSIYTAHSYHTKVPHKAIMRYILHYTEPDNVVLDGFCGSGMTGVAAQFCGDKEAVESLGYTVESDGTIKDQDGEFLSRLGRRRAFLNDLCPAATFISSNYNLPTKPEQITADGRGIADIAMQECGFLYATLHRPDTPQLKTALHDLQVHGTALLDNRSEELPWATINYTVWSDVFVCPECTSEVVFWIAAVDKSTGQVHDSFTCQSCNATVSKRNLDRSWITEVDPAIGKPVRQPKQVPVLINYSFNKTRYEKTPDEFDLKLLEFIDGESLPAPYPSVPMMFKGSEWGDTWRAGVHAGVTHSHHFYTKRNLWATSVLFSHLTSPATRCALLGGYTVGLRTARFLPLRWINKDTGPMKPHTAGTLYIPSLNGEQNWFNIFSSRLKSTLRAAKRLRSKYGSVLLGTASLTSINAPDNSVDYIFTDPPFGGNLMYSELNFQWESWLGVFSNNASEAIVNASQEKGLSDYEALMTRCFAQYFRVLKPGRWMTVEFHNSKNSVWNAIQQSLQHAGFVVADVRTLDKKQGSFKQVTSVGAVKQDLIISAYKPNGGLEARFHMSAGTDVGVWEFVDTHLRQVPVFVENKGCAEIVAERQDFLLFDRMVGFHVQRGVTVPLSAAEFYGGLREKYPERDGMFFLHEQVAEYDRKRMTVKEIEQLDLFVTDEASAIQWLKQTLKTKPQTFQELQPQFMQEVAGWQKHEKTLELSELLEQNFLCYDQNDFVPSQIHGYLSSNFKDIRKLAKDDSKLKAKARGRWYVADPRKEVDLEKIRRRALMKEFDQYRQAKGKLKTVRTEALRAGFRECWQNNNYSDIVEMAGRIREDIIQEDPALLMYYDNAVMLTEG